MEKFELEGKFLANGFMFDKLNGEGVGFAVPYIENATHDDKEYVKKLMTQAIYNGNLGIEPDLCTYVWTDEAGQTHRAENHLVKQWGACATAKGAEKPDICAGLELFDAKSELKRAYIRLRSKGLLPQELVVCDEKF